MLGTNIISFEGIPFDSNYEYAIATIYDRFDGLGQNVSILSQETIRTENILTLSKGDITQESVSFNVVMNDTDEVGAITSIELYKGETLLEALTDLSTRTFTDLLSNNAYAVKVTYTYDLNDGEGSQTLITSETVTTLAKATPTVSIDNVVPTQETISFELDINDNDEVGAITSIELYKGETLVEALTDLSARTFTDLLSNNAYSVKVTYTYDLNDGAGSQTLITSETVTTLAKATPTVSIDNVVSTTDSITFDLYFNDTDLVGEIISIELYQGDTVVESLFDLSSRTFENLISSNEYDIKVTFIYDLNDGAEVITDSVKKKYSYLKELFIENQNKIEFLSFGSNDSYQFIDGIYTLEYVINVSMPWAPVFFIQDIYFEKGKEYMISLEVKDIIERKFTLLDYNIQFGSHVSKDFNIDSEFQLIELIFIWEFETMHTQIHFNLGSQQLLSGKFSFKNLVIAEIQRIKTNN
jgi:hypothetical protein